MVDRGRGFFHPLKGPTINVLLSQPGCYPCKIMKGYLEDNGVPFAEKNIREDNEALALMSELGYKTTPVLVRADGTHFAGMKMSELEKLVSQKTD